MPTQIRKNLSGQKGFTLIELLASIFIIGLISVIFIVNYHSTSKHSELNMTKQKLASDIRVAQNNSLGSKTYDGLNTPIGGWGAHFDINLAGQYIIFADKNADKAYSAGEAIETKTLPTGVIINLIKVSNITRSTADIVFFPPDPVTYINNASSTDARIELKEGTNNSLGVVTVNFFGLIDTQ